MQPIVLPANQPPARFYRGGAQIREFRRGNAAAGDFVPEDWVASTTTLFGEETLGLTKLPDGRYLRDAIAEDPIAWLGADHIDRFGTDTKLLVKLLDAGQRLPVHAHPNTAFASQHLGVAHGKAEAWYALAAGTVYAGLKEPIAREELLHFISEQRDAELLALLHEIQLRPGDTFFVPPGTLHAIGEGNFVVEVQEPEDLSILLEWSSFAIDGAQDGHLGLGFDCAVEAICCEGFTSAEVNNLVTRQRSGLSILTPAADEFFRLGSLPISSEPTRLPASFAVMVCTDGTVQIRSEMTDTTIQSGDTLVVAHAVGDIELSGVGTVVNLRPPR